MTQAPAAPRHVFRDRQDAGRVLAGLLHRYRDRPDVLVLALPRGGVPVAYEVGAGAGRPARRLRRPQARRPRPRGAGHGRDRLGRRLRCSTTTWSRGSRIPGRDRGRRRAGAARAASGASGPTATAAPRPRCTGRTVILVDDGLATGSTMQAAVAALRGSGRPAIVVAVPAAPASTCGSSGTWRTSASARHPRPVPAPSALCVRGLLPDDRRRGPRPPRRAAATDAAATAGTMRPPETKPPDDLTPGPRRRDPARGRHPQRRRPARPDRRRAVRPHRRGVARDARVLPRARPDHRATDRGEGLHRRGRRGRLARRVPRQPLRPRPRRRRRRPRTRCVASGASRPGCGATPTCSTSSAGCASTTTSTATVDQAGLLRAGPLQPPRLDRGGASATSTRSTRRPPSAPASATPASTTYGEDPRPTASPRALGARSVLRARGHRPAGRPAAARRRSTPCATGWIAEDDFFYAEQNARLVQGRRAVLPHDVPRARSRPGTCATATWPRRSTRCSSTSAGARRPREGRGLGPQLPPRRRPRDARWAPGASCNVGQLVRERYGSTLPLVGFTTYTAR